MEVACWRRESPSRHHWYHMGLSMEIGCWEVRVSLPSPSYTPVGNEVYEWERVSEAAK